MDFHVTFVKNENQNKVGVLLFSLDGIHFGLLFNEGFWLSKAIMWMLSIKVPPDCCLSQRQMVNLSAVAFRTTTTQMLLSTVCEAAPPTKSTIGQNARGRSPRQFGCFWIQLWLSGKSNESSSLSYTLLNAKSMLLIYNQANLPYFNLATFWEDWCLFFDLYCA